MERCEVCFVPKPKSPGSFLLRFRGLTSENLGNLDQARMLAILGQIRESVDRAEDKVRRNPRLVHQFIEVPQFH